MAAPAGAKCPRPGQCLGRRTGRASPWGSQKRRAERAERFGPGSEKRQQQEQEEEDPRNRVEPATSSSQAGNWWEDPRNRAASSSSQAGNWWEDPRNRAASSSSQAAKWWEKDHDEGEDRRWYQSEQSQGPWSSQSSHQTWWENWEQPSRERSYSKQ